MLRSLEPLRNVFYRLFTSGPSEIGGTQLVILALTAGPLNGIQISKRVYMRTEVCFKLDELFRYIRQVECGGFMKLSHRDEDGREYWILSAKGQIELCKIKRRYPLYASRFA